MTKATAWAPTSKLASGVWTWRVETRDAAGVTMGTERRGPSRVSATWRPPRPSGSRDPVSSTPSSRLSGRVEPGARVGLLSVVPRSIAVGDRDLNYTVTTADLGRKLTLRATAKLGLARRDDDKQRDHRRPGRGPGGRHASDHHRQRFRRRNAHRRHADLENPDVTMTHRWLVGGTSVGTGPTFAVRASDLGKQVTFEVTGKRTDYAKAVVTSAPVTVQAGGALQATVQPVITGTPASGQQPHRAPGVWSQPSPTFKYQWLRNGTPIPSATGTTYRLTSEDAGTNVAVTVLASKTGFNDGSANAAAVAVARLKSTTAGALKASRIKVGSRGQAQRHGHRQRAQPRRPASSRSSTRARRSRSSPWRRSTRARRPSS